MGGIELCEALTGKCCTWCGLPTGTWCEDCEGPGSWLTALCTVCEAHFRKCTRCWCRGHFEAATRLRVMAVDMLQGSPELSVCCDLQCAMERGFLLRPGCRGGEQAPRSAQASLRSSLSSSEGWPGLAVTSGAGIPALPATDVSETYSEEAPFPDVLAAPKAQRFVRLRVPEDQRRAFGVSKLQMRDIELREVLTDKFCTWCGLPTGNMCDACDVPGGRLRALCTVCGTHLRQCTRCCCRGNFGLQTTLRVVVAEMLQQFLESHSRTPVGRRCRR